MRQMILACGAVCALLMCAGCGDEDTGPTHTYEDDRAAIQAIINANDLAGQIYVNDIARFDSVTGLAYRLDLRPAALKGFGSVHTIPAEIGVLTELTHWYMDSNVVSSLPSQVANLTRLRYWYASENQLAALPAQLFGLTSLLRINVAGNQIEELPAAIGQLSGLETLDVSRNRLNALPAQLTQLTAMQSFVFDYNAVCTLTPELLGWIAQFGYSEATWQNTQDCVGP